MQAQARQTIGIGVGVIVRKGNNVLLGRRKGSHGEGSWSFPGGHLEIDESPEECARREVLEETGLAIANLRKGTFTRDIFPAEGKHYVTLFILADYESGDLTIMEPDKCDRWEWFSWDDLPQPLFVPIENLLKERYRPF
jgi:8-oxo-dGTP diphosphatase